MKAGKREGLHPAAWPAMVLVLLGTAVVCIGVGSVPIAPGNPPVERVSAEFCAAIRYSLSPSAPSNVARIGANASSASRLPLIDRNFSFNGPTTVAS